MNDERLDLPEDNLFRRYRDDVAQMPQDVPAVPFDPRPARENELERLSIKGYFYARLKAGDLPQYGYPAFPLPKVSPDAVMEIKTGYMEAFRREFS